MRKILFFTLLVACCACKGNNTSAAATSSTDSLSQKEALVPQELSFKELIAKVPITPLPFGVKGLDTMVSYHPVGSGLPKWGYDSLNVYGLNNYFQKHRDQTIGAILKGDEFEEYDRYPEQIPPPDYSRFSEYYFAKRLPNYKGHECLVYFFKQRGEKENKDKMYDKWALLLCDSNGVVESLMIFSADGYLGDNSCIRLSYINTQYEAVLKLFCAPRKNFDLVVNEFNTEEISDEVDFHNRTILERKIIVNNLQSRKYTPPQTVEYVWIKNTPIECKEGDSWDSLVKKYNASIHKEAE